MLELQFSVRESNINLMQQRLGKLELACDVHNTHFSLEGIGGDWITVPVYQELFDVNGNYKGVKHTSDERVPVENLILKYERPADGRFSIIGAVSRLDKASTVEVDKDFLQSKGIEYPSHYHNDVPKCEHCESGRRCESTLIVYDGNENSVLQVARGCLNGYTFFENNSDESIESNVDELKFERENIPPKDNNRRSVIFYSFKETVEVILAHFLSMEELGFVSRWDASKDKQLKSTMDEIYRYLGDRELLDKKKNEVLEDVNNFYNDAVKYVQSNSDIGEDNLGVIMREDTLSTRYIGAVTFNVYKFLKTGIEKDNRIAEDDGEKLVSKHMGTVGDYLEVMATFTKEVVIDTVYGSKSLYFFATNSGDVLVWGTQKYLDLDKGDEVKLRGKVKEHRTYREEDQTFITYVKVKPADTES